MPAIDASPYALERGRALARGTLRHTYAAHLGAEPGAVFAFISDFPRLPEWMPLIRRATVDNTAAQRPGQVGAVRVLSAAAGPPTRETVVAFETGKLLAYSASDASLVGMLRDHLGVLATEPHPSGGTRFTWLSYGNPGSLPMRWLAAPTFRFVVGRSIDNLQQRFPV